jgi:ribosomal protein L44E
MGLSDDDPKVAARNEVARRDTQQLMRQFLKLESGLGNKKAFLDNWEMRHQPTVPLEHPLRCDRCDFVADDMKDVRWHQSQCPGHVFGGLG